MWWDDYDDEIPEQGYTVGGFSPAGRAEAQMAMVRDRDMAMSRMHNARDVHPDVKAGWIMNTQGQWNNAMQTAAASQWFNGYFRPGRDTVAKPFVLQQGTADGGYEDEAPAFRPGLTGAVQGRPMHRPYNNGDFSTQRGGGVGKNFGRDAFGGGGWANQPVNQVAIADQARPTQNMRWDDDVAPMGGGGYSGWGGNFGSDIERPDGMAVRNRGYAYEPNTGVATFDVSKMNKQSRRRAAEIQGAMRGMNQNAANPNRRGIFGGLFGR